MRKWMRDKLTRRKKSQEEAATGPAPLQPAYFEPEPEPVASRKEAAESVTPEIPAEPTAMARTSMSGAAMNRSTTTGESNVSPDSAPAPSDQGRRPRRRRRGGRGRRRPGQPPSGQKKTGA